jgi:hypothetical protein
MRHSSGVALPLPMLVSERRQFVHGIADRLKMIIFGWLGKK